MKQSVELVVSYEGRPPDNAKKFVAWILFRKDKRCQANQISPSLAWGTATGYILSTVSQF